MGQHRLDLPPRAGALDFDSAASAGQPAEKMKISSLGYRTDLLFIAFDGEIEERPTYMVLRSPRNPTYHWGNFLLFAHPPGEGDFQVWRELFVREIGAPPKVRHQVFGWDSPAGDLGACAPFLEAGFRTASNDVLTGGKLTAPRRPAENVQVRPLETDAEWEAAVEIQVACREPEYDRDSYSVFRQRQMEHYRRMVGANLGDWYAAFSRDQIVADLGIFKSGKLGRFQSVETHPDFRRRGIASKLVYEASRHAIGKHGLEQLVIVADENSVASRMYQNLGFQPVEKQVGLELSF